MFRYNTFISIISVRGYKIKRYAQQGPVELCNKKKKQMNQKSEVEIQANYFFALFLVTFYER